MHIFTWLAVVAFFASYVPKRNELGKTNYKNYTIFVCLAAVLVMGLRHRNIGADTIQYVYRYRTMDSYDSFSAYYAEYLADRKFLVSETGYWLFCWVLHWFSSSERFLILVHAAIVTILVFRFIYRYVDNVPLGVMSYLCLGQYTFNMTGMRQAMAMSLCLVAVKYIKERRFKAFILMVLVAMQFHKTAIAFLPAYFLPWVIEKRRRVLLFFAGLVSFSFVVDRFIGAFNDLTGKNYAIEDAADGGGISVLLIYGLVIALAVLIRRSLKDKENQLAFCGVFTGLTMYIARYYSNLILERVSYYYFYFILLLVPGVVDSLEDRERRTVGAIFCMLAIALLVYRIETGDHRPYYFFWER